jgi:imidazolonepropionase-like amidohydrolase
MRIPQMFAASAAAACLVAAAAAQPVATKASNRFPTDVQPYVQHDSPRIVLAHVRVIDGTGRPAVEDRNVVLEDGRIAAIEPGADLAPAPGTTVLDLRGRTVLPGLVGMHDHMYYIARPNLDATMRSERPLLVPQMMFSSPRLYLANGVTTARTTGSVEGYADINLRDEIDAGRMIGPHLDVTAPYLAGKGSAFIQMYQLKDAADARRFVDFWADAGATSFKAYMNVSRDVLKAAIEQAHARGAKVTGHLCSVTYPEAIELGIDDLEHGFFANTQGAAGKQPDVCPEGQTSAFLDQVDPAGTEARALVESLVSHHVAVTSTLPVFEHSLPNRPPLDPRALEVLTPAARTAFLYARASRAAASPEAAARALTRFQRGMALERAFAQAGGLVIAGPDPTGNGGTIPGFSNHREVELLVEAGFTPEEAIQVATLNGARYLGREKAIGSIEVGKHADLFVVAGNPSKDIKDIEQVELVFKDGVGYNREKLLASVRGRYGEY